MNSLLLTEDAFVAACHPEFPLQQILEGNAPSHFGNAFINKGETITLISTATCSIESRLLVIGEGHAGFFTKVPPVERQTVFERCVRIGLRSLNKRVALNPKWMPFRKDSRTSVFAYNETNLRILAETNYAASENTYVYELLEVHKAMDLSNSAPDHARYNAVIAEFTQLVKAMPASTNRDSSSVMLEHLPSGSVSKGFAYDEWLPLLSAEQADFVNRKIVGPLRVRGPAGTGKTLAMVMKALKLAKDASDSPPRILFLTHSWSMASQIDEMIRSIGRDIPAASLIETYPLLEISSQRDYTAVGRRPLGLDSDEGKREALKIIATLMKAFRDGDWIAYRGGCSEDFIRAFESPSQSRDQRNMSWDLLIEFGCVLAANGLLGRGNDREKYMRIRRVGYMMPLANSSEKAVVFRLWTEFLAYLTNEKLISSDQIVSDYLNELQTFYWEAKRTNDGYDYIFVDEMHLFNAQERLIFHNLLADGDAVPRVVLALDPKQSPREVFAEISDDRDGNVRGIYERARLPNPDKIDFLNVYRYTKEIAALTKSVIDTVPGLDMEGDWNLPGGNSVVGNGPVPTFYVEQNSTNVYKRAMEVAQKLQREARTRGGQVAVLCMDYERFSTYHRAAAGQYPNDVFVIRSRDDVDQLRYMTRRIVFSTPEYVAGLQFDSIVLADVNGDLVHDGNYKGHQERQFLSELYLGMSRAEVNLVLIASRDSDGLTPYLKVQERDGLIKPADSV